MVEAVQGQPDGRPAPRLHGVGQLPGEGRFAGGGDPVDGHALPDGPACQRTRCPPRGPRSPPVTARTRSCGPWRPLPGSGLRDRPAPGDLGHGAVLGRSTGQGGLRRPARRDEEAVDRSRGDLLGMAAAGALGNRVLLARLMSGDTTERRYMSPEHHQSPTPVSGPGHEPVGAHGRLCSPQVPPADRADTRRHRNATPFQDVFPQVVPGDRSPRHAGPCCTHRAWDPGPVTRRSRPRHPAETRRS